MIDRLLLYYKGTEFSGSGRSSLLSQASLPFLRESSLPSFSILLLSLLFFEEIMRLEHSTVVMDSMMNCVRDSRKV